MVKRKDPIERIVKSVEFLVNQKEIINASKEIRKAHIGSLKKLIILSKYLYPHLTILTSKDEKGKPNYSDAWFYIDFCSGSGASTIKNKFSFIGSPIIALLKGVHYIKKRKDCIRFTKWFFMEIKKKYRSALQKRVEVALKHKKQQLKKEFNVDINIQKGDVVFLGDCNKDIDIFLKEVKKHKRVSILVFADPEGFTEIEYPTLKKLFRIKYVDIIYIFSTSGYKRGIKKEHFKKYLPPMSEKEMEKILKRKCPYKELVNIFMRGIFKELSRPKIIYTSVPVHNEKKAEIYRIVWASCSKGAVKSIRGIINSVEKLSNKDLFSCAQRALGKQKGLKNFLKD